jgi:hypothetical protein
MFNNSQHLRDSASQRCSICGGKFGLVRYYSWRTAFCSRKCTDRFKTRQDGDRRWLPTFQVARQTVAVRNHEEFTGTWNSW